VSGIVTARLLGPSGKGILALALVWTGLAAQIVEAGVNQAITYHASKPASSLSVLWGQALGIAATQSAVAVPAALVASHVLVGTPDGRMAVDIALLALPLSFVMGYELSLLRGLEKFVAYNGVRLLQAGLWAGSVVALAAASVRSPVGALLCYLGSVSVAMTVATITLLREIGRPHISASGLASLLRYSILVWVAGIGYQANARIDQFILGAQVRPGILGQYAAAVSLASVLTIVSMGLAIVTLPAVARAPDEQRLELGRRHWLLGVGLMAILGVLLGLAAPSLVPAVLGADFRPAVRLVQILLLGQIALGSTQILHEVARGQGRLKLPAATEGAGAILTVGMLLFAIPRWGALGAAWVSVIIYWLVSIVLWTGILRRHGVGAERLEVQPADETASPLGDSVPGA
jgi:O-antigen/teichoic acid export membrane protein